MDGEGRTVEEGRALKTPLSITLPNMVARDLKGLIPPMFLGSGIACGPLAVISKRGLLLMFLWLEKFVFTALTLRFSSPNLGGVVRTPDWLHTLRKWVYPVRARFLPCAAKDFVSTGHEFLSALAQVFQHTLLVLVSGRPAPGRRPATLPRQLPFECHCTGSGPAGNTVRI